MPIHDARYQHWEGRRLGIWARRATVAANGLRGCLAGKWVRRVLVVCWSAALAQVALLFLVGQLLVTDSLIVRSLENLNPQLRMIAQGLMAWLEMHPEISVHATQNVLFYYFGKTYLPLSLLAIALALPHLITRDLSSNAIVVYSSKALSRFDYLLGKFGTIFGLLTLTWLGPVCFAWLVGNLMAPQWHFFWHARLALGHALLVALASTVVLSCLALGVSAVSAREKVPVGIWLVLWLVCGSFTSIRGPAGRLIVDPHKAWIDNISLPFNLEQISAAVFRLPKDLELAQENIPMFGQILRNVPRGTMQMLGNPDLTGALIGLAVMAAVGAIVIAWRVKPE